MSLRLATNESLAADQPVAKAALRVGYRLKLNFPLNENRVRQIQDQVTRILERETGQDRPIVLLEFVDAVESKRGEASKAVGSDCEFEPALSLARWLSGPVGSRVRSVAYLPHATQGHALIVALGCEEIAMAPLSEFGPVINDDQAIDPLVVDAYLNIAKRRSNFPEASIRAMFDKSLQLFQIRTNEGETRFVDEAELMKLRESGLIVNETQISIPDRTASYVGQELRSWQWISYAPRNEDNLLTVLDVGSWKSLKRQIDDGPVIAAVVEVRGVFSRSNVNRWLRVITERLQTTEANLLVLQIHSNGGSLDESLRFTSYLSSLDREKIQIVSWIDQFARGDSVLVGLATDTLYVSPKAILGGPGEASIKADDVRKYAATWSELATLTGRSEGEIYGLLSTDLTLHEYLSRGGATEIGDTALFEVRPDFEQWERGKALNFPAGMSAQEAIERRIAADTVSQLSDVARALGLESLPEPQRISPLEQWIQSLADQEWLAALLLTLSIMLFTNELTTPGFGIAGFMSMLCMLLFFWLRFLNGTVEWLEILLCVGGLLALGLELFVLPGFGIFGFGGFLMLIAGIVLASQTFVIPTNDYQWSRLAMSLTQVAFAMLAFLVTLYFVRDQLEHLPFFKLLRLDPPVKIEPPPLPNLSRLIGKTGSITARCAPIGTAWIDDQLYEVFSPSSLIEAGTPIVIVGVRDQRLEVREQG